MNSMQITGTGLLHLRLLFTECAAPRASGGSKRKATHSRAAAIKIPTRTEGLLPSLLSHGCAGFSAEGASARTCRRHFMSFQVSNTSPSGWPSTHSPDGQTMPLPSLSRQTASASLLGSGGAHISHCCPLCQAILHLPTEGRGSS